MQPGKLSERNALLLFIILIVSFGGLAGFAAAVSNGGGAFADMLGTTLGLVIGSVMLLAVLWPDFGPRRARS